LISTLSESEGKVAAPTPEVSRVPWWKHAVVYQIYLRSFADGNGDGIGDLPGVIAKLPYLRDLGVDAVWLTPFDPSPGFDQGYDISDHCNVDPLFGTLDDFDQLVATAHSHGIRIIIDVVPNHCATDHPWFQTALIEGPGGDHRQLHHFRPGRDDAKGQPGPPNNWDSFFGGSAWTQINEGRSDADGEWYLHLFDSSQPDFNWDHKKVQEHFAQVLRFWLDRGVDGLRIDVAHGMAKEPGLPNQRRPQAVSFSDQGPDSGGALRNGPRTAQLGGFIGRSWEHEPMCDQPAVHKIFRQWRAILDRVAIGEAWVKSPEALARYLRPDELHQAFNFDWLVAPWSADAFAKVIEDTFAALNEVGASPTWVLSNHDVVRHPSRYGGEQLGTRVPAQLY
jgi:alpha-glucosidase